MREKINVLSGLIALNGEKSIYADRPFTGSAARTPCWKSFQQGVQGQNKHIQIEEYILIRPALAIAPMASKGGKEIIGVVCMKCSG